MASPLAKGLMWGIAAGSVFGVSAYELLDFNQGDGIPGSRAKVEACAAALGNVATDVTVLDPACQGFSFRRTEMTEIDPLQPSAGSSHIIYHLPARQDFPAFAAETKQLDDNARHSVAFDCGVATGITGFLAMGGTKFVAERDKRKRQRPATAL